MTMDKDSYEIKPDRDACGNCEHIDYHNGNPYDPVCFPASGKGSRIGVPVNIVHGWCKNYKREWIV